MNARSIKRLRRKFIIVAGLSFFTVIVMTGLLSVVSINRSLERQADMAIERILRSGGSFAPEPDADAATTAAATTSEVAESVAASEGEDTASAMRSDDGPQASGESSDNGESSGTDGRSDRSHFTPRYSFQDVILSALGVADVDKFSTEYLYGARYFTVSFDKQGNVTAVNTNNVYSVSPEEAVEYAKVAADPNTTTGLGQVNSFYYREGATSDGSMVVFLDCTSAMLIASEVTYKTFYICLISLTITLFVVAIFSSRAIRPEVENARRQQQCITNASHELKTPLAVIRANTEVTEMMSGQTEWTTSTMRQVDRMDGLIQNLVMIARATESENTDGSVAQIDAAEIVRASVEPFGSLASQSGLELTCEADGPIPLDGTASSVQQLVTLLVDNAIKYCDEGGHVRVEATPRTRGGVVINVSNSYAEGEGMDLNRFFDRFYREDEAHSNQKGYGIGLSVVESIAKRYKGSVKVGWASGDITFTCVLKRHK